MGFQDYQCLCGWGLLILGVFHSCQCPLQHSLTIKKPTNSWFHQSQPYSFLLWRHYALWLQSYKQKHSNDLTAGLLLILSFVATNAAGHLNSQETDIANGLTTLLLLVSHTVLWGYVIWRGVKTVISYSSCLRCHNSERRRFLYEGATSPPQTFTIAEVH